ncbi:MAG: DUF4214 domain-containing protein [Planctomycetes bacterium]|nr:DUF4214 domain-containing protein [Planctomycetota bacterium]
MAALIGLFLISCRRRAGSLRFRERESKTSADVAWREAALATLLLAAAFLLGAGLVEEPYEGLKNFFAEKTSWEVCRWTAQKLSVVLGQQLALQLFLAPLVRELMPATGRWPGAGLAALIFGLIHLPSPALVGMTLAAGLVWIRLFDRGRRLLPLFFSHLALAVLAHAALPERLHYDMRVGRRALDRIEQYRFLDDPGVRRLLRQLSSRDYMVRPGLEERGFLDALFQDLLGRPPAPEERRYWSERLQSASRFEVAKKIIAGEEFRASWAGRGLRADSNFQQ